MSDEEQIIAIAEFCGWRFTQGSDGELHIYAPGESQPRASDFEAYPIYILPKYTSDLNAVRDAEVYLRETQESLYYRYCEELEQTAGYWECTSAAATQRSEALCRTLWPEKWKEKL